MNAKWLVGLMVVVGGAVVRGQEGVKMWEEGLVVPTYRVGAAEKNPVFYTGRSYQGAKGPVYPYPMLDRLSDVKEDKTYRAVWLENRWVRYSVLPEIGGRIFSGKDKSTGYDFLYRQHVIKPALIGMVGAWISGGVEWNIPHHHRASTFMPVDYRLIENADGSKTVWVGEMELRHRMRWVVGMTMWANRSYLKVTVKLFNRTALPHSMLYFANVAVHANENYQVIFPPGTEFGTQHGKKEFVTWPVGDGVYGGMNRRGVDLSWWKNLPTPASIFAWNYEDDWFGGYDHGKQAGMVVWADHQTAPGKKFFEWGNGSEGNLWDKILTDADGPYLELMAGGYSDNQPDYSWVQPGETKVVEQWFYPVRGIGGVTNANREGAVNVEVKDGVARVGFNATSELKDAKVVVEAGGKVVVEEKVEIGPGRTWVKEVKVNGENVKAGLWVGGKEVVGYRTEKRKGSAKPRGVEPPGRPETIKTNEELYLAGLRLEQFHSPAMEAESYYQEAIKRDPGDCRANVAMGILYCRRGMWKEAEERLRVAVERVERNYTRAKDGEGLYYLGVALRGLARTLEQDTHGQAARATVEGKLREAEDAFGRAAWSAGWVGASCYQLAEMACASGEYGRALELVERAIGANGLNVKAMCLKAAVLRRMGRFTEAEAEAVVAKAREIDPLDHWAGSERWWIASAAANAMAAGRIIDPGYGKMADKAHGRADELAEEMRGDVQAYLELAADYGNCGMWDEAITTLRRFVVRAKDKQRVYPMVHYYLGYYLANSGNEKTAGEEYALGEKMAAEYCFPFQIESAEVLRAAMKGSAKDAVAPYLLGNLLYDLQPGEAVRAWEKSAELGPRFATVHRNLGVAYGRAKEHGKAMASLEMAVKCDPKDARLFAELDAAMEAGNVEPGKRLAVLEGNHEVVKGRDDALLREIELLIVMGRLDRAIELIEGHHFHLWEGQSGIHDVYVDAHVQKGKWLIKAGKYAEAMREFEAATKYPENLETARPTRGGGKAAQVNYMMGVACEGMGEKEKAKGWFEQATRSGGGRELSEGDYYQGLAWRKLGEEGKAKGVFAGMVQFGQERLAAVEEVDFFAKFGTRRSIAWEKARAHYVMGLGLVGPGKMAEARKEFEEVLKVNAAHLGARVMLAE